MCWLYFILNIKLILLTCILIQTYSNAFFLTESKVARYGIIDLEIFPNTKTDLSLLV